MPQGLGGQLPLTRPIHPTPAGGFFAQGDVLGHRQMRGQIEFLMNHRHSRALGGDRINGEILRTVEHHGARIGFMDPAQDLEQGAFPSPILPDEGMGLAGTERQAHPPQRLSGTEGFSDSVEFESGWHGKRPNFLESSPQSEHLRRPESGKSWQPN